MLELILSNQIIKVNTCNKNKTIQNVIAGDSMTLMPELAKTSSYKKDVSKHLLWSSLAQYL